jgi:glyoxylase-like metal-dependent hydrolase (beta-lactamase superfamily II)
MTPRTAIVIALAAGVAGGGAAVVHAQRDWNAVKIEATSLGGGIHMLKGAGGNLGVCVGPDGVFVIDDQYAPLTDKIRAAIAALSDKPIRFVVNTHWHGDHTGGNENMAKAGATIVAHDNVRRRLATDQIRAAQKDTVRASPAAALPVVTFSDTVTMHVNGETLVVAHVPHAHTDGDAIVWFRKADVVHMGDVFFNGNYPFIDVGSGGSIDGVVAAVEGVLAQIGRETRIIPGHGPVADRAALTKYHAMLTGARDRVRAAAAGGKPLGEVQAAKPTAEWDAAWGNGFIKPDRFVESILAGGATASR